MIGDKIQELVQSVMAEIAPDLCALDMDGCFLIVPNSMKTGVISLSGIDPSSASVEGLLRSRVTNAIDAYREATNASPR